MSSSLLELPHNIDGEVDWDTLGKILCAQLMGEVLCASYVDKKYGIASPQVNPDTEWKFLYHEDNVVALEKSFPGSPIKAFMGRGVIDLPMDRIIPYLESHEHRKEWDRFLVEIKEVRRFSPVDSIIYMRSEATNCLVKQERDFLHFERMAPVGDKYVRSAVAVELLEFPPKPGLIRAELKPGSGWLLEPYRGCTTKTLVSYLAHMDLKVLPPLIINRIIRRQPKAIHRIRKILERQDLGKLLASLSHEPREDSPWSEDSLSSVDRREVVRANEEYYRSREQPYSDDLTIDAFTGNIRHYNKIERTISVNFNPHSENGQAGKKEVNVKAAVASEEQSPPPSSKTKRSGFFRGSFKKGRGSLKGKKKSQPKAESKPEPSDDHKVDYYHRLHSVPIPGVSSQSNGSNSHNGVMMHSLTGDVSSLASTGTGLLWQTPLSASPDVTDSSHFIELPIDSDPHIPETTGLVVDGNEEFYTPHESEDEQHHSKDDNSEERMGEVDEGKDQKDDILCVDTNCSGRDMTEEVTRLSTRLDRANGQATSNGEVNDSENGESKPARAAENGLQEEQHTDEKDSSGTEHRLSGKENSKSNSSAQTIPDNGVAEATGDHDQTSEDSDDELSLSMPFLRLSNAPPSSPLQRRKKRTSSEKMLVV